MEKQVHRVAVLPGDLHHRGEAPDFDAADVRAHGGRDEGPHGGLEARRGGQEGERESDEGHGP